MKKLVVLAAGLPSAVFAHGGHMPVPEAVHGAAHAGIWVGLAVIVLAGVVAWAIRVRS